MGEVFQQLSTGSGLELPKYRQSAEISAQALALNTVSN
jgi:hypothetical protein